MDALRSCVVQPLFFGDRLLGMEVLEMAPRDGTFYEALRAQVGAAVEAVMLSAEQADATEQRHRLLQRTAIYATTLERLYGEFAEERKGESSNAGEPPGESRRRCG